MKPTRRTPKAVHDMPVVAGLIAKLEALGAQYAAEAKAAAIEPEGEAGAFPASRSGPPRRTRKGATDAGAGKARPPTAASP